MWTAAQICFMTHFPVNWFAHFIEKNSTSTSTRRHFFCLIFDHVLDVITVLLCVYGFECPPAAASRTHPCDTRVNHHGAGFLIAALLLYVVVWIGYVCECLCGCCSDDNRAVLRWEANKQRNMRQGGRDASISLLLYIHGVYMVYTNFDTR